jgi:pSer/pThr/pTyr-binding forkhead associated (FHA) protein
MSFGRLDVYWPDGPIETYQLGQAVIGIGRQRDNDIVLDTTTVSRYHTSLTFHDDQCYIQDLDSANGTYVDGAPLEPSRPYLLRGGEELQIGDVRAIFHAPTEVSVIPDDLDETQVLELAQPTFQVTLEGAGQAMAPGVHAQSHLLIENIGGQPDRYFIEIDGVPKEWVHLDRAEVELGPGERIPVVVTFKPPRRSESAPGEYSVNLQVRASTRPAQTVSANLKLRILPYYAFGLQLDDAADPVRVGQPFTVHTHNQGNAPITVSLSGRDPKGRLRFHFQPRTLSLQPGQRLGALATVQAPWSRRLRGETAQQFAIVAASHDAAGWLAAVPGHLYILPPRLSNRAMLALIGAVVIALATLVTLAVVISRPIPPEIVSPLILNSPADRAPLAGDVLGLSWEAQNAAQLRLSVSLNGLPSDEVSLGPEDRQYTYAVAESGLYQFTLVARSGDLSTQSVPLIVEVRPRIVRFEVEPRVLVRAVRQTLTISWETQGARGVRITGLDWLLGTSAGETHVPQGSQTFEELYPPAEGIASLSLVVLGNGVPDQQSTAINVLVIPAECRLVQDGATLYDLEGRPPLALLSVGELVNAQARDPLGQWVRVTTQAGHMGWLEQSALHCESFDLPHLIVDDALPTPIFTLTPTPTQTPSPTPTYTPTATPSPTPSRTWPDFLEWQGRR